MNRFLTMAGGLTLWALAAQAQPPGPAPLPAPATATPGASAAAPSAAPAPAPPLMVPPADAEHFTILSTAGRHGTVEKWRGPDGAHLGRLHVELRGQVWDEDESFHLGTDGALADYRLRGTSPNGDVGETFTRADGVARWRSPFDGGSAPYAGPAYYLPAGWDIDAGAELLARTVAAPGHDAALLPSGHERVARLATATVGSGPTAQALTLWAVTGVSGTPFPVWTDAQGRFFAGIGGLATIRAGYEDSYPRLEKLQDAELARQSPRLARALGRRAPGPLAFTDVRAFVAGRFLEHRTVVVARGRIVAVGPAGRVRVPRGARVVAGAGKTLVPGLWDCHMHVGDDYTGPSELSLGVTSVRDPGNKDELTIARRGRRARGELLAPHVYASSLIDSPGPRVAQVANIAATEAEAIGQVRAAKAKGMKGVKFYGSFNPAWVRPAAAEAHRLGLHVHGHVPAGMRPREAIDAGYDEITHIYFVAMQAMPDDVVRESNGMARFSGTGRYFKDVDLDAEPMHSLVQDMARRHIYSDPTLVVVESLFQPENGDLSPSYAPFVGTLPPAVERGFRQGGFVPPPGTTRADYRASLAKLVALVGAMHQAGVPIVAGTDGSGLELVRELELYEQAGFTPAAALEAATIVPARLVGADSHTGSIAVGKDADLVLVDGDPSQRIGDLRHTELVLMDGRVMDADALRAAVGVSGRPK